MAETDQPDYHAANRNSWNAATTQHHSHKQDLIARYQNGFDDLHEDEIALLGDVRGKSVVHLQCNDGQQTISIGRKLGAIVSGVDISDTAIDFAQQLAEATSVSANFHRADIFEWFETNTQRFDVVYTGYGALNWLSDITRWGAGVAKTLTPGGRLVVIEFHPLIGIFENDWSLAYDYMGGSVVPSDGVGDYVGNDWEGEFQNPHRAYEFAWGIGDILTSVLAAGLRVDTFVEYNYLNVWQRFPNMRSEGIRQYAPDDKPNLAMMFGLVATKPNP